MEELCLTLRTCLRDAGGNGFSEAQHRKQMCIWYFLLVSAKVGLFSEYQPSSSISEQQTFPIMYVCICVYKSCFIFLSKIGRFPTIHG